MSKIAEEIFSKLSELHPTLERKGVIAGQAVATVYQSLKAPRIKGLINDIDQFFMVTETSDLFQEFKKSNDAREKLKKTQHILLGEEVFYPDNYSYYFNGQINRAKDGYTVFKSEREGLVNKVFGCVASNVKFTRSTGSEAKLLIDSFDLNCVKIGIYFDETGEAQLYKTDEYDEFLLTNQILIVNNYSLTSSIARAFKKAKEMGSFFNIEPYKRLYQDILSKEIQFTIADNIYKGIIDEYAYKKFEDIVNQIGLPKITESLDSFSSESGFVGSNSLIIHMQHFYNVPFGYRKKEIQLFLDDINKPSESIFITIPSLLKDLKEISRSNISYKELKRMAKVFKSHEILSKEIQPNLKALKVINEFQKTNLNIIGFMELVLMKRKHFDLKYKLEMLLATGDGEGILQAEKEFINQLKTNKNLFLNVLKSIVPKSFFGYKISFKDTYEELIKLGQEERHCVGGYWYNVLSGRYLVFTIENTEKKQPRTTVGANIESVISFNQQYAKSNSRDFPDSHKKIAIFVIMFLNIAFTKNAFALFLDNKYSKLKRKLRFLLPKKMVNSYGYEPDEDIPF